MSTASLQSLGIVAVGCVVACTDAPAFDSATQALDGATISVDQSLYTPGQDVIVTFAGASGAPSDWLSLALVGDAPSVYRKWQYTNGGDSGTLTFTAPNLPSGTYEARLYFDWNGTQSYTIEAASAAFTVANSSGGTSGGGSGSGGSGGASSNKVTFSDTFTVQTSTSDPEEGVRAIKAFSNGGPFTHGDNSIIEALTNGLTFDTSNNPITIYGVVTSVNSTRVAGSRNLTNVGVYGVASGGDVNYSGFFGNGGGVFRVDDPASMAAITSTSVTAGALAVSGSAQLGDSSHDTLVGGNLVVNRSVTTAQGYFHALTNNGTDGVVIGWANKDWSFYPQNGDLNLFEYADTISHADGTDRVTFKSGGAVGIGTTSPSEKLEVKGNIRVDGHVVAKGPTPSVVTCGDRPTITGSDAAFRVVTGTGAQGCSVTFAVQYGATPICTVSPQSGGELPVYELSESALTIDVAAENATYNVTCVGV